MSRLHSATRFVVALCLSTGLIAGLLGTATTASATSTPGSYLVLPYFEVDADDPAGLTTLWSVRNSSSDAVEVVVQYVDADTGSVVTSERLTIDPNETVPRNLRDVPGIPDHGWALFFPLVLGSGSDVASEAIHGDFFWVEPGDAFASGGTLLRHHRFDTVIGVTPPAQHDFCRKFETRNFNGGAFDGGSDIVINAHWDPFAGFTPPLVTGSMYDEAGTFRGTCTIGGPAGDAGAYAVSLNTALLEIGCPDLPDFGVTEWAFADGVVGHVAVVHRASGLFSVSTAGSCTEE